METLRSEVGIILWADFSHSSIESTRETHSSNVRIMRSHAELDTKQKTSVFYE